MGPAGERVAENVKRLRGRTAYRELSAELERFGRPILPSGLLKLERGQRRVDVDDLIALALALDVSPVTLLMPAGEQPVQIAPEVRVGWERVGWEQAWRWACGEAPLFAQPSAAYIAANRPFERGIADEIAHQLRARTEGPFTAEFHYQDEEGERTAKVTTLGRTKRTPEADDGERQ